MKDPWSSPASRSRVALPPGWSVAAAGVVAVDCALFGGGFAVLSSFTPRDGPAALFWFSFGLPVWQLLWVVPLYLGLSEAPGLQPHGASWARGVVAGAVAYAALQLYAFVGLLLFSDWE